MDTGAGHAEIDSPHRRPLARPVARLRGRTLRLKLTDGADNAVVESFRATLKLAGQPGEPGD
jgi:hypothetical protein